ncbi:hypothetical protein TPA0907_41100 [Micromonospora humidisoli]|uniref:Uncharacterized protein n=1 Tax=Micromonospora humidisoli TaxID=2807622 RepID=A0ABS2J5N3_9ACTN|nr:MULTISPECIES: hypothetical protein [Micromonospora]MBM7081446.1 hypothetical protein [Micromonospora humidisoli]GHJ09743.1 hypothetical protein TPA0907_41100 [Micromonospora sp. AKA109]
MSQAPGYDPGDLLHPARVTSVLCGLTRVVARLALAPDEQREYLRRAGTGGLADELALQLEAVVTLLEPLEEANLVDPAQAALAHRIDQMLDMMSGADKAHLWEPEALSTAPEWVEVRALAKEFLFLPDPFGGT